MPRTQAKQASENDNRSAPALTLGQIIDKEFEKYHHLHSTITQFLIEKTLEKGTQEGIRKGEILGMRQILLESITCRFGPLPHRLRRQIDQISSQKELLRLARRVIKAKTLSGLRLRAPALRSLHASRQKGPGSSLHAT